MLDFLQLTVVLLMISTVSAACVDETTYTLSKTVSSLTSIVISFDSDSIQPTFISSNVITDSAYATLSFSMDASENVLDSQEESNEWTIQISTESTSESNDDDPDTIDD